MNFKKLITLLLICTIGATINAFLIKDTNVYSYILGFAIYSVVNIAYAIIDSK